MRMVAFFDGDTKRFHRYSLVEQDGIQGTLYISKDSAEIPKVVEVELKVKSADAA